MQSNPAETSDKVKLKRRPTIEDLAEAANVSVATVDRVLNKRHPVREDTARRVVEAAEHIGFYAHGLLQQRLDERIPARTFAFLLQRRDDFYRQFGTDLAAAVKSNSQIRGRAIVEFMEELSPGLIVERLRAAGATSDAIGVVSFDHPYVNAEIEALKAKGVPVFALLADLSTPARAGHLGLDGRKAGRTAAWSISRIAKEPGKVGILIGSHRYLNQEMAEISFRTYLREHAPAFVPLEPIVNLDDSRIAYEATLDLISANPGLAGIYAAGGGMSGLIQALREEAPADGPNRRMVVVCNELIPDTRSALIDGVIDLVIATPTALVSRRAVEAMIEALATGPSAGPRQVLLPAELYISENV